MTKINRALISVSDKTGLDKIVEYLDQNQIEIISTGGTCKKIQEITQNVIEISDYTGFPEIMNGRVKTLNPFIHGGVLANRDMDSHQADMANNNIKPIDLIIVNLYPFEEVVSRGAEFNEAIENIDVGGPTMVRAAAKNHKHVVIITDPSDYDTLIEELKNNNNETSQEFRKKMAIKAFAKTAKYDTAIHDWFQSVDNGNGGEDLSVKASLKQELRYGENPHQQAKLYKTSNSGIVGAEQIQGKELSFNNINDADNAYSLIKEFKEPAAAIIKHANPCGVAVGDNLHQAFTKALSCDPVSSFGGIIALNRVLDRETAEAIKPTFFEVIIAPEISEEAKELLATKKNMRILLQQDLEQSNNVRIQTVSGGLLVQDQDIKSIEESDLKVVTKRAPTDAELASLLFSFKAVKHVRSNAVLFAKDQMTTGIGAGQMSRVDSVRIATLKLEDYCKENAGFSKDGMVLASDAFFPFPDGLELAAKAGATAIIQPGGSIRDDEVIAKADELGVAMVFTGVRHFKH